MNKNQKPGKFGHLESFRPQLPHQRHTARWGITMVAPWEECLLPADLGPAVGITPAGDGTKTCVIVIIVMIMIYIYIYMYIYICMMICCIYICIYVCMMICCINIYMFIFVCTYDNIPSGYLT